MINPQKKDLKYQRTQLMAILNCTPDSFFDGGRYDTYENALAHGEKLIEEGADILDIGGESTRPGAAEISAEEEIKRVLPLVEHFAPKIKVSIDTSKPEVAIHALKAGAGFINDVTGLNDPLMVKAAIDYDVDVCVMHMQGTPRTMQANPSYPKGVVTEIMEWFKMRVDVLLKAGIKPERLTLDPGIGFGKTAEDNVRILRNLPIFQSLGFPLLIGLSRKSFMSKILKKTGIKLLSTTLAMNTICISEGVSIIRVHDVKEHRDIIDLMHEIQSCI